MIRDTSTEAYNYLTREGILSRRRREAYKLLFKKGPGTASEICWGDVNRDLPNQNFITRLGELRDMGLASEIETRQCKRTGKTAIVFDVTSRMHPLKLTKRETLSQKYRKLLSEVEELRRKVAECERLHGPQAELPI